MRQTFTSRQYSRDPGAMRRAADHGMVIITERGKPAHVLMTYAAYRRLKGHPDRKMPLVAFLESLPLAELDLERTKQPYVRL
jgi:hypothetical protein